MGASVVIVVETGTSARVAIALFPIAMAAQTSMNFVMIAGLKLQS
jgi:hypothetical protein